MLVRLDAQWHPVAIAKHGTLLTLIALVVQWEPGNAWEADDKLCNAYIMVVVNQVRTAAVCVACAAFFQIESPIPSSIFMRTHATDHKGVVHNHYAI